jgi:hypothetical protein
MAVEPTATPKKKKRKVTPDDGVTHINIWLHGQTPLGRMLSHFYNMRFTHPVLGPFNSMEGLWHYVKTTEKDDNLRKLHGGPAKDYGKKLTQVRIPNFRDIIIAANFYKIEGNPELKKLMIESTLPFRWYFYHGPEDVLIEPPEYEWLVEGFEEIRRMLKEDRRPPDLDYSAAIGKKAQ